MVLKIKKLLLLLLKGRLLGKIPLLFVFTCAFLMVSNVSAQSQEITGTVTDESGNFLPGVTVLVVGKQKGTTTDFDGNYSVSATSEDSLEFSFLGFNTREILIKNQSVINVTLATSLYQLDDVVVVGYGTTARKDLTGAIGSVNGDLLAEVGAFSVAQALQGKVSGVQVTNNGDAGSAPKIRIRGINTIGDNNPLIVVDGIINGPGLEDINPADIKSIDVLKDASALAIYGSNASNGVIMVTTKKGNYGQKSQISLNVSYGVATVSKRLDLVSADGLVDMIDEARRNENEQFGASYPLYDEVWPNDNWGRQDITDWQDELFDLGTVQDYALTASGGSDSAIYSFGVSYRGQGGTMPGNFASRLALRGSTEFKLNNDKIKLGATFNYVENEKRGSNQGDIWDADLFGAAFTPGNIPAYFEDGNAYQETDPDKISYFMPGDLYQNKVGIYSDYSNPVHKVFNSVYFDWEIIEGLSFKSVLGLSYKQNYYRNYNISSLNPEGGQSNLTVSTGKSQSQNWDNTLTYKKDFNDLMINAVIGTNINNSNWNSVSASRSDFPDGDAESMRYLNFGNPATQTNSESASNSRIFSYFGRLNMSYDSKYLFTATVRRDGSSRFHEDVRWGTFPSFSLGWNLSEESFLNDVDWLDVLKLRTSWGQVGNQNVGSPYAYLSTVRSGYATRWGRGTTDASFGSSPTRQIGKVIYQYGNENVTWETTTMFNLGTDFSIKGISGALEFYKNNTTDILLDAQFPDLAGYFPGVSQKVNSGEVETKGFEFDLNYSGGKKDFTYNVGVNYTYTKNKIISLSENKFIRGGNANFKGLATSMSRSYVGDAIGSFYGFNTMGIFNTQSEVDAVNQNARNIAAANNPSLSPEELLDIYYIGPLTAPGDYIFEDIDGDGIITDTDIKNLGNGNPVSQFGINLFAGYKGFDLSMNFTGTMGVQIYSMFEAPMSVPGAFNSLSSIEDHWTQENPSDNYPRYTVSDPNGNLRPSNKWIHNGDYFRMQSFVLGYTFPTDRINKFRLYFNVQNVFTITNYPFLEPEVAGNTSNNGGNVDIAAGVDVGSSPVPRTMMLGLNVNF